QRTSLRLIEINLQAHVSFAGPKLPDGGHVAIPVRLENRHQVVVPNFETKSMLHGSDLVIDAQGKHEIRFVLPGQFELDDYLRGNAEIAQERSPGAVRDELSRFVAPLRRRPRILPAGQTVGAEIKRVGFAAGIK